MAAVRIENEAWNDPRYAMLATLCDLADPRFALILCGSVWSYCTDRNEDVLSESLVDALAKHKGFARKMIQAELAQETKRGIRIKGARGRIEWLASKRKNGAKGGKRKASNRLASASDEPSERLAEPQQSVAPRLPSYSALLCSDSAQKENSPHPTGADDGSLVGKLVSEWDPCGQVSPLDRQRLESIVPKLAALAADRKAHPVELFAAAVKRLRAHKPTAAKRMCTVSILCSQLEQWVDDAPEPEAPKRRGAPAPVSTDDDWDAQEARHG